MQWLNEPEKWEETGGGLSLFVTPKTDFWRKTHYGFTVDDGPFYYASRGGEFEVSVKITGEYQARFDQMGLMLRVDEKNWIKTGVEYVNEKINISSVVTHQTSDWSVIELDEIPDSIRIKAVRRLDGVEISHAINEGPFQMSRLAWFPQNQPVMVGMFAASPDGEGFEARFDDFTIGHLPDATRMKWLRENT